jgi:methionine-rich copper-binding protein CopC
MRRTLAAWLAAAATMTVVGGAAAHGVLDRTDPRAGGTVKTVPSQVKLWFTGALEPAYSRVQVIDAAGKRMDLGDGGVDASNHALLRVSVPALAPGTYRVVWRVLSVDSHVTEGQFSFQVVR